ncbi:MAG: peptidyl-prolyl cis-trans isomerase D [Brevundimonas sp.]|jgi:peptidyl-prolyl cis-trans isomerase D|uniref:peptidylprolyl isomerase n=1 Tax=Brevundimonas sp. TaxID=1871086 RepID=UPI0024872313|nr:peptidylprolyl isomerase [Brevundimonas sp.]MDI1280659.1 SurA N-terminal domain-containing protein [Brevundimonas sp.]
MISVFRNFAKSKWAIGLIILLGLGLLVTGGSQVDVLNFGPKHVITAGDRSVGQQQFRTDFERIRNNLQEQAGRPVSIDDLINENIHLRYLDNQTQRLGFLAWAWKAGIRPGKALVLKQIRQAPVFFNQVTGEFDDNAYKTALAAQNITPAQLEQEFRDEYASNHFNAAIFSGTRLPRIYGALVAGQALETRDGRFFTVTQAMAGTSPKPTEAQLTAFMTENADRLRQPEYRMAALVLFNGGTAATAPIAESRIQERFEFRKDALSDAETRTFVTLTAPTRAAADKVATALRAGQTPAQAAAANGAQVAPYTDTARAAIGDPAIAAAVFGLAANEVSAPIQGRVGFTVARVESITPGRAASLDGVRDAIIAELRQEDVRGAVYDRVDRYEKARTEGKTLEAAAQEVGARIIQLPPFTEDGKTPDGQPMNAPPQIFSTAWSLTKGAESEVVDAGQGQYFVLRLDDIRPASLPALADIRAPLEQQWLLRENNRLLVTKAEELAGRIRAGEDVAAVARSIGATVQTHTGVKQDQQSQEALGQGGLQGLFGQGRGQVFTLPQSATSYVIGRVDQIHAAVPALAAPIAEQVRPRMTQEQVQAMIQQAMTAAAARTKATYDLARARVALGLSPEAAPAAAGAPAPAPAPAP